MTSRPMYQDHEKLTDAVSDDPQVFQQEQRQTAARSWQQTMYSSIDKSAVHATAFLPVEGTVHRNEVIFHVYMGFCRRNGAG